MSKVLVLYYSSYGHIEAMANAVAEGARQAGAQVDIKRVPELVPEEIARKSHYKVDQVAPIAKVDDLVAYDAIIIGAGTRFGRLPSRMANFPTRPEAGRAEHCTARSAARSRRARTQHGGQETTLFSIITNLLHFGMVVVGLDHGQAGQMTLDEITGRLALRCHDDHRRRWLATAHGERARGSPLPGSQDCGDRKQAARLTSVTRVRHSVPREETSDVL